MDPGLANKAMMEKDGMHLESHWQIQSLYSRWHQDHQTHIESFLLGIISIVQKRIQGNLRNGFPIYGTNQFVVPHILNNM